MDNHAMKQPEQPKDVRVAVDKLLENEDDRSYNRRLINDLFNGDPPYTQAEVEAAQIETNVNFLDATRMAHDARTQLNQAFLNQRVYFTVTIDNEDPPPDRDNWGSIITKELNRILKRHLGHQTRKREGFAQRVLHGVDIVFWGDKTSPFPESVAISNFLVPERAGIDPNEWEYFAIVRDYAPGELMRMAESDQSHWDMAAVRLLVEEGKEAGKKTNENARAEEIGEDYKGLSFYDDTEVAKPIRVYDFFFKNDDGTWERRIVPEDFPFDQKGPNRVEESYLYEHLEWETEINRFLVVHYADGNSVAPFRYHTVRGLGFMLYSVGELMNRAMSKFYDKVFEEFMQLFRIQGGSAADRLQKVTLHNGGVIPEGLQMMTANERFSMNPQVVSGALNLGNQKLAESSQAFTRSPDLSSSKELTATEVQARLSSAGQLVQGMLAMAKLYEYFEQVEIARRFSAKSSDKFVTEFWKRCKKQGVPDRVLKDYDSWEITTEMALGSGMQQLELVAVTMAMQHYDRFPSDAQKQLLHKFIQVIFKSPDFAELLVPISQKEQFPRDGRLAQIIVGALMDGAPVAPIEDVDQVAFIGAMLASAQQLLQIEQRRKPLDEDKLVGLGHVLQFIEAQIQFVDRDPNQKQRAKQMRDALAQIRNVWEQLFQNLEEQAKAQSNAPTPELIEKQKEAELELQAKQAEDQLKIQTQTTLDNLKVNTAARLAEIQINVAKIQSNESQESTPETSR